jgi:hypothetical protein
VKRWPKQLAHFHPYFRNCLGEMGEIARKIDHRRSARIMRKKRHCSTFPLYEFGAFHNLHPGENNSICIYVDRIFRFHTPVSIALNLTLLHNCTIPGVVGVSGVARDPQALVGSEKNTVYGIDVASFKQVAYLPDSFFVDGTSPKTLDAMRNRTTNYAPGSAQQVLDALASTPNGVIISVEQAEKYNIQVGDPVLLRLYNRVTKQYTDVQALTVGLFTYFPTSSQDSDFILNRDFMTQSSGNPAMDYFLIKTDGSVRPSRM